MNHTIINIGLYLSYALVVISLLIAIASPVLYIITHPKKARESIYGILFIGVILLIGYLVSGSEISRIAEKFNLSASQSKVIGGGLISMYIFSILAFASIIYSEVIRWFK